MISPRFATTHRQRMHAAFDAITVQSKRSIAFNASKLRAGTRNVFDLPQKKGNGSAMKRRRK
jgi:hypothetical protein